MILQHLKMIYDIASTAGIRSALEYDAQETLERHPKLVKLLCAENLYPKAPLPKPQDYAEHFEFEDGWKRLIRQGWFPAQVDMGQWTAKGDYSTDPKPQNISPMRGSFIEFSDSPYHNGAK